jgi:hypothetical protein
MTGGDCSVGAHVPALLIRRRNNPLGAPGGVPALGMMS